MRSKWFLLILLGLQFCSSIEEAKFLRIGSVEFDVGFIPNHRFRGVISSSNENDLFFYFGEPVTRKIIKIFSESGELKFEVPLQESIKSVDEIETFQVISPDTIVIFGKQNNKIVLVDHFGKIWRNLNLDSLIVPYNNYYYNYRPSFSSYSIEGRTCFLKAEYQSKFKDGPSTNIVNYFSESLDLPYFLKINDILNHGPLDYKYGQLGFYRQFMNDTLAMSELPTFSIQSNIGLVYSIYSDSIYVINNDNLLLTNKFKVVSDETSIGSKPINLNDYQNYENYLNTIKYEGHIIKAIIDKNNECYVISVACENTKRIPLPRKYTYCVYDFMGNKKGEFVLKDENNQGLIYFHRGIYYVSNNSFTSEGDKNSIIKYDMFNLDL